MARMPRGANIMLGVGIGLSLLIAGAYLFFPKDAIRNLISQQGSSSLGRPVSVGDISLSLWGGIGATATDIRVDSPPGISTEPLLSIRAIDFKVAFWPLLSGKIEVSSIAIDQPHVTLVTVKTGRTNYEFPPASDRATPDADTSPVPALSFEKLTITAGQVKIVNDSVQQSTLLTQLAATLSGRATGETFLIAGQLAADSLILQDGARSVYGPLTAALSLDYQPAADRLVIDSMKCGMGELLLTLNGTVSHLSASPAFELSATLPSTGLEKVIAALPADHRKQFTDYSISGDLYGTFELHYDSTVSPAFRYEGMAELKNLQASVPSGAGNLTVERLESRFATDSLWFGITNGAFAGQPLAGQVSIVQLADPRVDGMLAGHIDLALLAPWLPPADSATISGSARFDLRLRGLLSRIEQLTVAGQVSLTDLRYDAAQLPEPIVDCDLTMTISSEKLTITSLSAEFPSSELQLTGTLQRPFPWLMPLPSIDRDTLVPPFLTFALRSKRLNTDKLFPEAVPDPQLRDSLTLDSLSTLILPDIDGRGTFVIDSLVYCSVDFTRVKGDVSINDRIISCTNVSGAVYTGSVSGTTDINLQDFSRPVYGGTFTAQRIEADDFVRRFSTFSGIVFGKLNLSGSYQASGWEPPDLLSSLTLDGKSLLSEGKIVTSGPVFEALNGLSTKLGREISAEQSIRELVAKISVESGKVIIRDLTFAADELGDISLDGFYGFDGTLGYAGAVHLSEESSARLTGSGGVVGALGGLLKGKESGRVYLPLKADGTLRQPNVRFDYQAIGKSAIKNIVSDTTGPLKGLFRKKSP